MQASIDPHAATLAKLAQSLGDGVYSTSLFRDNLRLYVPPSRLVELLSLLKNECGFNLLSELGAPTTWDTPAAPVPGSRCIMFSKTSTRPNAWL